MEKLNHALLDQVKKSFVAMPGGDPSMGAGPVAGGGLLTQAQASPMTGTPQMDPAMMGGDPAAMGGDPAAMGGAPMDPSMAGGGGMPPPPMDPSMMGGAAGGPPMDPSMLASAPPPPAAPGSGMITMSVQDLITIIQSLGGSKGKSKSPSAGEGQPGAAPAAPAPAGGGDNGVSAKLDQILQAVGGGQQMPPMQ